MGDDRFGVVEGPGLVVKCGSPHEVRALSLRPYFVRASATCGYCAGKSIGISGTPTSASIFAMVQHYSGDKEHIYGLDIHYLDAARVTT